MSAVALILNLLLGGLLLAALGMGWRLERRLKALRDSQATFVGAVQDLDRAAARAEQGLADLRAATDEAAESLAGRIAQAKTLSAKLDASITRVATLPEARVPEPRAAEPRARDARPDPRAVDPRAEARADLRLDPLHADPRGLETRPDTRFDRATGRGDARGDVRDMRNDLILEDEAPAPGRRPFEARVDALRSRLPPAQPVPPAQNPVRSRARVDDDLFDEGAASARRTARTDLGLGARR